MTIWNGSYSSSLSVRVGCGSKYHFSELGYYIELEGSYHKIVKGYNSHNGYYDLGFISNSLIDIVELVYNIHLPSISFWYLQRCDIAICFDLENQVNVRTYINNLSACKYPRRNLKFYQDESVYVSGTSTTLKIYNKLLEFRKHDIKKFIDTDFKLNEHLEKIKGFIRFECEIKKKKIKDFYKSNDHVNVIDVKYEDLKSIWVGEFMKLLKFIDSDLKVVRSREEVFRRLSAFYKPVRARNLYNFYLAIMFDGVTTIQERMSKSSFYENISSLKQCNIDVSQKYNVEITNNLVNFNPFEYKEVI